MSNDVSSPCTPYFTINVDEVKELYAMPGMEEVASKEPDAFRKVIKDAKQKGKWCKFQLTCCETNLSL
jgi:hypothetical protein